MTMSDPYQIVFSPDGRFLTVAGLARDQIDIYDAQNDAPAAPHPCPIPCRAISTTRRIRGRSSSAFQVSGQLIAIDTATGRVDWQKPVGNTPAGVLWHDGMLMVGIMGEAHVAEVDPATGAVIGTIPTKPGAHVMFIPPGGRIIYVTDRESGYVSILDAKTLAVLENLSDAGRSRRPWISRPMARSGRPSAGRIAWHSSTRRPSPSRRSASAAHRMASG